MEAFAAALRATIAGSDPLHLLAGAAAALILAVLITARLAGRGGGAEALDRLGRGQQQLVGALTQMAEAQAGAQIRAMEAMERRLDEVSARVSASLAGSASQTAQSLGALGQRLSVIDAAQGRIEQLSGNVLGLQEILSNKQARGVFGEVQLAEILRHALPSDAYALQATLSNGRRADALIRLPQPPGPIAIDSKFPLEAYRALAEAKGERDRREAARALRAAVQTHIADIAGRYIIEGETAESALMFLPSEAVYAELHANHAEVVRHGFERRVWIVSPTTTMALLTTMRGVMRDARIASESGRIRAELGALGRDIGRLVERVGNLERHLAQAGEDLRGIRISADRTAARATRLEEVEFGEEVKAAE
ncbi:DNA recombination protein RmuC [Limibaculum sp. FT325]|uniref:DNA recombination protein RmuC n=1 Tax=Thermohalobaculum sediminis TaxID=2939436 RepID=UPI0020BEB876|nr:DNA recombination protein RmuC [Limibaculum sediminis]MCL5776565.1 DNA recombination protein RmuC [Limibaculum sediminis]